jgi:hypothetical protein
MELEKLSLDQIEKELRHLNKLNDDTTSQVNTES